MVERLRRAGGIFIGKTNTPEFGLGSHTYNPVYGATRNAYDQTRSAGGSSGGAAVVACAAHAAGRRWQRLRRKPAQSRRLEQCIRFSHQLRPRAGRGAGCMAAFDGRGRPDGAQRRGSGDAAVGSGGIRRAGAAVAARRRQRVSAAPGTDFKGKRIAWCGDFGGYLPFEPGVLDACRDALKVFESMGCNVEEAQPDYSIDAVWRAWLKLRAWQAGGSLLAYYNDPAKRALLKPEAVFEVESGSEAVGLGYLRGLGRAHRVVSGDAAASSRSTIISSCPPRNYFRSMSNLHWPREIAGRKMQTYHEWMKCVLPITMSGCPALAAPAGFGAQGLPIGIQIVGPQSRAKRPVCNWPTPMTWLPVGRPSGCRRCSADLAEYKAGPTDEVVNDHAALFCIPQVNPSSCRRCTQPATKSK